MGVSLGDLIADERWTVVPGLAAEVRVQYRPQVVTLEWSKKLARKDIAVTDLLAEVGI